MKKILALVLTLAMVAMIGLAFAGEETTLAAGTIRIKSPKGLAANDTVTYKVYKVFDATSDGSSAAISYKLVSGKTTTPNANFTVDNAGNVSGPDSLSDTDIADIAAYVTENDLVATIEITGPETTGTANVGYGYFYITTTTGSLVTIDSTNPVGDVNDKNTIPGVDKTITGASDITDAGKKALAQIGTDVTYTAVVTVGKGSTNLAFHDKMDDGLTFKGNDYVEVSGIAAGKYTIKDEPDQGDTLTITFDDGIAEGTEITITYVATINEEALTKLENDAYVSYGDSYNTTHSSTETYNAEIGVIKYEGAKDDGKFLGGAGFKLKNSDGKYYKLTGTTVSWVDNIDDGDEHTSSGTDGKVPAFIGLANGTYTLEETTVPPGFNKAEDIQVTIQSGDYTLDNLQQIKEVENYKGTELPSTGGIGTTIFYVLGGILVIGAAVILIARRKAHD